MKANTKYFLKRNIGGCAFVFAFLTTVASAQSALSWEQVKAKFEAVNPVLKADAANVDEMKAEEITAFLRPNPQFTVAVDGTQIAPHDGVWTPVKGTTEQPNFSLSNIFADTKRDVFSSSNNLNLSVNLAWLFQLK